MIEDVDIDDLDIAIAHWHVNAWGGAEYLVTRMAESLDIDAVYTIGEPDPSSPNPYGDITFNDVTPSLDYTPVRRLQQRFGRVFEYAQWEDVDWREFGNPDVLVTSGATTRAVITQDDTAHLNYCHSPPRWFYDLYHDRKASSTGTLVRPLIRHLRIRDMSLDPRVDEYLANSPIIRRRLWKYYKRDADVLYPPIDLKLYRNGGDEGFYLHLGRLDEEKGVPAVVQAFENSDHQLVLAGGMGDIDDKTKRRLNTTDHIEYRGFVDEERKLDLLARCRAVVFNGRNEDFGIVPVEANASGKPVLSRDEGFPSVFLKDGKNGYFHDGTADGILKAIERQEDEPIKAIDEEFISGFAMGRFESELRTQVREAYMGIEERVRY